MPNVIITAHRGMGVTAKRRDHYIDGVQFFPENSIAAFKRAIELKADAIEFDIHVSSNNTAMVIHGEKLRDYAYKVQFNETISIPTDKERVKNISSEKLSSQFRLKTFTDFEQELLSLTEQNTQDPEVLAKETTELWHEYAQIDPDLHHIPTLEQLLALCAAENKLRAASKRPPLKLNIELKGTYSGLATLATIIAYNKKAQATELNTHPIDPSDIILLGRLSVGEIITAKSLIIGAQPFLNDTENMPQNEYKKKRHDLLKPLFGIQEKAQLYGQEGTTDREKEKYIPKSLTQGYTCQKIVEKYAQDNDIKKGSMTELEILRQFLTEILTLSPIRTNVMLSTGELYGQDALLEDNQDFDLQEGVQHISSTGYKLIEECMTENGYDGIDISLFDFEMETCRALLSSIQKLKANGKKPIIGATASNWKGVQKENSPITPAEALLKAHCIAQALDVDIILKVDEPGFFKTLYQPILNGKYTLTKAEALYDIEMNMEFACDLDIDIVNIEATLELDFKLVTEEDFVKILLDNYHKGYEITLPKVVDILSNSPKPPRGPSKQHSSSDLSSDPDSIAYSLEQTNRVLLRKTSFSTSDEDLQLNDNNEFLIFSFEAHPYLYNGLTRFDSTDQDQSTELDEKEWIEQMEINKRRYS